MHPWPSCFVSEMTYTVSSGTLNSSIPYHTCNGRTRNAASMSIWVCTRPHYFYCPSSDFTTSCLFSQSVTNNRCALSCEGTIEKWGGTSKKIRPALRAGIVPPTCKLLPTPLTPRRRSELSGDRSQRVVGTPPCNGLYLERAWRNTALLQPIMVVGDVTGDVSAASIT